MSRATFFRGVLPVLCKNSTDLELWTNVPVDDQFSSPKQARWSTALGKLLVANGGNIAQIRNPSLDFYSKYLLSANPAVIDSDSSYIYYMATTLLRKLNATDFTLAASATVGSGNPRMIDASGDPSYIYVTTNKSTAPAFHGVYKVRKSDMTIVAQIGGDAGAGDGQFSNPLGVKYYNGYVYVADATNTRIVKLNASGAALTFDSNISVNWNGNNWGAGDLDTDGLNWYLATASSNYIGKFDMNFACVAINAFAAGQAYSLCIIPDQSDGYGQTIAVCSNTNSNIKRHKCSDLSLITTVGSAGDGSSSLFDPTFTTSSNTRITYQFDDGFSYTTPSGTSHALSWNGFAGYSFRNAGPHRCVVRVEGGLGLVTGIDAYSDALKSIRSLSKLSNLTYLNVGNGSTGFTVNLGDLAGKRLTYLAGGSVLNMLTGNTNVLSAMPLISVYVQYNMGSIYGSLSDFPATCQTVWGYINDGITPASIAHLTAIRDLRIYSMGWNQADLTTVIDSMYTARAAYTYAFPSLQIGGTNPGLAGGTAGVALPAPTTTPGDGNSNSDWSWNGVYHEPLTAKAKAYYLINGPDHGTDTFNRWSISANN